MMAAKALLFGDAETAARMREAPHPGAAEALGRQVRGFQEQRWAERRFEVVVTGTSRHSACILTCASFAQYRQLGARRGLSAGPDLGYRACR
jgi:predicted NAD-dependent protein-ADP-ribosyltransferase YbiA (DUF1768 family)